MLSFLLYIDSLGWSGTSKSSLSQTQPTLGQLSISDRAFHWVVCTPLLNSSHCVVINKRLVINIELFIAPPWAVSPFPAIPHSYHILLPGAWQAGSVQCTVSTPVLSMDVAHTAGSLTFRHWHGVWHKDLSGSILGPTCWLASWRCCIGINTFHHTPPFFPSMASRF